MKLRALKNHAIVVVVHAAVVLVGLVPARRLGAIGAALGRFAHVVIPSARRHAREGVAIAFPDRHESERTAIARRSFAVLGRLLGETAALLRARAIAPPPIPFEPGSEEILRAAIIEGRGVVLASAHLGPYERVAQSLAAHGIDLLAVTKAAYDPRLDFVYARTRAALGVKHVARDREGASFTMVRHLRKRGVLGVPMDLASRVPSVVVPFLGRPARTAVGPARLALATGARVVVCTAAPFGDELALRVTTIDTRDLEATAEGAIALTTRLNAELGERIRALPFAWPWMHPRWEGVPRSSPASQQASPDAQHFPMPGAVV